MLHVWFIHLHLADCWGKYWHIFHTWSSCSGCCCCRSLVFTRRQHGSNTFCPAEPQSNWYLSGSTSCDLKRWITDILPEGPRGISRSIEIPSKLPPTMSPLSGLETCHSDLVRYLIVVCWCGYSWSFRRILISCHVLSFNLSIIYHTSHIYIYIYVVHTMFHIFPISYHIINSALYIIIVSHHLLYHIVPGHFPTSYRFHTQWRFMESAVIPRRSYVLCCSQTGPFSPSWFKLDTSRIFCFLVISLRI